MAFQDAYNTQNWDAYLELMCPSWRAQYTGPIMDATKRTRADQGLTTITVTRRTSRRGRSHGDCRCPKRAPWAQDPRFQAGPRGRLAYVHAQRCAVVRITLAALMITLLLSACGGTVERHGGGGDDTDGRSVGARPRLVPDDAAAAAGGGRNR